MADSERVEVKCRCGARLKVPAAALGRKARCPKCREVTVLRAPQAAPAAPRTDGPAADGSKKLTARCDCGAKLAVPAAAAGRRVKCPKCGAAVAIPKAQKAAPASAVAAASPLDDLLDGLADGQAVDLSPEERAALKAAPSTDDDGVFKLSPATKPTKLEDEEEPVKGPPIKCPGCATEYPPNAKICPTCGINLKTGRALMMTDDSHIDHAYIRTEGVVRWLSWLIPWGIYPVASEAFGTRTPWVTRGIAVVTILISAWYMVAFIYNPDPDPGLANLMFWTGGQKPDPREMLRDEGLSEKQIDEIMASGAFEDEEEMISGEFHGYQLFTHVFLHMDPLHLAGNLLFLMVFGSRVNAAAGNLLMLLIYPLLGVAACIHDLMIPATEMLVPTLGASGAVMGLAGVYLVLFPVHKVHMAGWWRWGILHGFELNLKMFAVRGFWVVLVWIAFDVFWIVIGVDNGVAHWAHVGGFLAGIAVGLILLAARLVNSHGGDILTAILGRHAWALIGKPNRRGITLW